MENKCRICLGNGIFQVFEHKLMINDEAYLISEALEVFTSKTLSDSNVFNFLCNDCTQELGQAYSFYIKVKLSETQEHSLIDDTDNHLNICMEDGIDELISEYKADIDEENPSTEIIELTENEIEELNAEHIEIVEETDEDVIETEREIKVYKRPSKIPNIHLTSNVSSIIKKVTNSIPKALRKRKSSSTVTDDLESNEIKLKKFKKDTSKQELFVPQLVINHTKLVNFEKNEAGFFDGNSTLQVDDNILTISEEKATNQKVAYKKRLPPQPTYKVTMDFAPVSLDSTLLEDINKLDKNEDSSVYYQCQYCPKAFATQYHLGSHNQKSHVCQHCLKGFVKVKDLYAHIKSDHSTHTCSICSKKFSTNSNLRVHVKKVHGIQLPAGVVIISNKNYVK